VPTPERWQEVERLYHAALDREQGDRAAFVRDASSGDEELVREVISLLDSDRDSQRFLNGQAIDAIPATAVPDDIPEPLIGHRLGPYAITALLGFGGMGDVYRARDTKLGRDVAIKILPEMFAADSNRRARFEREARLLAALNHPHIAAIYGFEDSSAIHALVLELVDGNTLAERLVERPMPLREALTIAKQIAAALEAAHAKGIVHRDLKPRNIAIAKDGTVKVLDFGLAKAALEESDADLTREAETRDGMMIGTTPYMSPEQARGKPVDMQTDVWAFGCVLVEMLTGRRVFAGESVSDTISAILEREPAWHLLPSETPAAIVQLAKRCLEKDRSLRLHDIADARIELDDALRVPLKQRPNDALRRDARPGPAWRWAAAAALVAATAGIVVRQQSRAPATGSTRLSLSAPGSISPQLSATVSPDGRRIAFVSTGSTGLALWIRDLDAAEPRVLSGTENAAHPFWSPDGRFIGFLADGKIKKVPADGGPVEILAETSERAGPSWSRNGQILFVSRLGELGVVSADGGPVSTVIAGLGPDKQATWPHFLPDGRHFLFFVRSAKNEERGVYVGTLGSKEIKQILRSEFKAAYAAGHLLFVRGETLMAQPFDLSRLALGGAASRIADGVWAAGGAAQASFSASEAGVIVYVNTAVSNWQLAWFDRSGRALEHVGTSARYSGAPQLSRDGRRLLITQGDAGSEQIWSLDTTTDQGTRMTFGADRHSNPVWSGDSARIAFQSPGAFVMTNADASGQQEAVSIAGRYVALEDWSPDGRFLVYSAQGPSSLADLWLLPLAGDRRPVPFAQTSFNKEQARVSPDSHWIAYTSYESGHDEVFVESFPSPGNKRQVSTNGGVQPRWRRDGAELYYVALDQRLMAVPVGPGAIFQPGSPQALFRMRVLPQGSQSIGLPTMYDVSPDGRRFLCRIPSDESGSPISVILNWTAALPHQ
jgi:serine/threonine protein kinase